YPIFSGIAGFQADGNVHWFHPVPGNPNDIDLTSDGRNLVIVSDNGTFEIVRHTGERVMHDLLPPLQDVDTLPQADQYLLTSRLGNQVFLYDSQSKARQYFSLGFEGPVDTDLLPNGNFLVCETPPGHSGRVRELTPAGETVWLFERDLKQPLDALRLPGDLTVISDFDNHRLLYVRSDGAVQREVKGFDHPAKLTLLPDGDLLVADRDHRQIVRVKPDGSITVVRANLNCVQSAILIPHQNLYVCAIHNRYPIPPQLSSKSAAPTVQHPLLKQGGDLLASPLVVYILAAMLGLGAWLFRRRPSLAGMLFLGVNGLVLGCTFWAQCQARAADPYLPTWPFWLGAGLLLAFAFREARDGILDEYPAPGTKDAGYPFSIKQTLFFLLFPLLGVLFQALQYPMWPAIGTLPWIFPMTVWAVGMAALLTSLWKHSIPSLLAKTQIRIGAASFVIPWLYWNKVEASPTEPVHPSRAWANSAVLVTLAIAACLYLIHAPHYPTDVHGDEGEVALFAMEIRDAGVWNFFNLGWYHIPYLFYLVPAWGMWLFGDDVTGIRIVGALISLAAIPIFYLLARRILQDSPAAFATFLFATSGYFVHFSRMGIGYNQAILVIVLLLYCLVRGVQDQSSRWLGGAGMISAIGWLSYQAAQIGAPLALASIGALWLLRIVSWRTAVRHTTVFLLAFWVTISPLLGNFAIDPSAALSRASSVSAFTPQGRELMYRGNDQSLSFPALLALQTKRTLLSPLTERDRSPYLVNPHSGGILDTIPAIGWFSGCLLFFLVGWSKRPWTWMVLFWTGLIFLFGCILTNSAPPYQRLTVVYPLLILPSAAMVYGLVKHWGRLLPLPDGVGRLGLCLFAALLLILSGHRYFRTIQSVPQMVDEWTRVARYLQTVEETHYVYFLGPPSVSINYGTIRFLARELQGEDIQEPGIFLKTPVKRKGAVSFVLVRGNRTHLPALRALYPGGIEKNYYNSEGGSPFTVYEVSL
ncbi:MAG: glycosyltransferase family 39 protein, partial [bacterium]|nr:glycosyltransferase family 39 protein [bacterium]